MTALLIIGIVVLIIALLLLCSVSLHVKYDGEASAEIGYLFLSFSYPKKRKLKKQKISDEQKKEEDKPHKTGTVKKLIDEKGLSGAVSELSEALMAIVGGLKTAARHLRVNKFDLFIKVATTLQKRRSHTVRSVRLFTRRLTFFTHILSSAIIRPMFRLRVILIQKNQISPLREGLN